MFQSMPGVPTQYLQRSEGRIAYEDRGGSGPLVIALPSLGDVRQEYRFQLQVQGGINPLKWEVTGGSLPQGITLNAEGVLSGIPSERGQFRTLKVFTHYLRAECIAHDAAMRLDESLTLCGREL